MRCCAAQTRRTRMYSFLLALIYIAFISLGLPDSLLGSGWPVMHLELGVPISYMGIVSMVISGGTIVSSLMSDRLNRKLGTRIVTVMSVFLTVIALFGFSFSSRFWMLIVFAVPYGLGAGAIDAALNNYVALHYKAKHMSWLHSFWGVGTIVSPFIMGYALTNRTWNSGCRIVGAIQLAIAILLHRDPAGVESQQGGGRDGEKERRTRQRAENKGRAVPTHRLFRLLRSRNDRHAVGEHIFRRSQGHIRRARGNIRVAVLYRHHRRAVHKRIYHR